MQCNLEQAVALMKEGREEGFNEVYEAARNRVYVRAKRLMCNEEHARDLMQNVFMEAYCNIASLRSAEALFFWLDSITYRQAMKMFRKFTDILVQEEFLGVFESMENWDVSTMPELAVERKDDCERLDRIIAALPEPQKDVVLAYYFDGLKQEQIAEMMDCSVGTVKSRLHYARNYIRKQFRE